MNFAVRGYWITSAVSFMKNHYAKDVAERLPQILSDEVGASALRIGPVEWCPRSHHVHAMKAIAAARSDESGASDALLAYGRHVAAEAANGLLKPFVQAASLKLLVKAMPKIWERDHQDDGRLEVDVSKLDESCIPLRLTGIRGYDHVCIAELGWIQGMVALYCKGEVKVNQSGWSLRHPGPSEATCEVSW